MLSKRSRLRLYLGNDGVALLAYLTAAIQRLLPHVDVSRWSERDWKRTAVVWSSNKRTAVRITIAFGDQQVPGARSIEALVTRKVIVGEASSVLDAREHDICALVATRISEIFRPLQAGLLDLSSQDALRQTFDESIVARHLQSYHATNFQMDSLFRAFHTLSEQSYENKQLAFGCIIDASSTDDSAGEPVFPEGFAEIKKFKALSDGFRTSYLISSSGAILNFVDLESHERPWVSEKNYFPEWSKAFANCCSEKKCGVALSRQGDILVFDGGTLRFTYRYGRWQYWNHRYLIRLLRSSARAQHVSPKDLGRVVGAIYRVALDVSFRRSGGLFVVLRNQAHLRGIVRRGDAIGDAGRGAADQQFDDVLIGRKIQFVDRTIIVELAALDGAVVLQNSGQLVAYAAILAPKKKGRLRGSEGSRTKAAIGASNYGLAVKISSDGEISSFNKGDKYLVVS